MKRIEVRCTEEELARWKEAAGLIPLSRWIRLRCEGGVDRRRPLADDVSVSVVPSVPSPSEVRYGGSFKPDFGGRLKK